MKNIIKRRVIFLTFIVIVVMIFFVIVSSKQKRTQLSILYREQVQKYLDDKYVEPMVLTEDIPVYPFSDSIHFYDAFPENNEDCKFRAWCVPAGPSYDDDYLVSILRLEANKIVQEVLDCYYNGATCYAMISDSKDFKNQLYDYYNIYGEPLSWNDSEYLNKLDTMLIQLYEAIEDPIYEMYFSLIINDIQRLELSFDINDITFIIYKDKSTKKDSRMVEYILKDGKYSIRS